MPLSPSHFSPVLPKRQVVSPRLQFKGQTVEKPIQAFFDVDGTLVQAIKRTSTLDRRFVENNARVLTSLSPQMDNTLITGRSLEGFRETAALLPPFNVARLGMNNGQELYINENKLPLHTWLGQLSSASQDTGWRDLLIQQLGWNVQTVLDARDKVLKDEGFHPAPVELNDLKHYDRSRLLAKNVRLNPAIPGATTSEMLVEYYPDQPVFLVSSENAQLPETYATYGQQLADKMMQILRQQGVRFKNFTVPLGPYADYVFTPEGTNKGSLVRHLVGQQSPRGIIVAGDHRNDLPMLTLTSVLSKEGTPVPVHPLISGTILDIDELRRGNPNTMQAKEATNLGESLKQMVHRILTLS